MSGQILTYFAYGKIYGYRGWGCEKCCKIVIFKDIAKRFSVLFLEMLIVSGKHPYFEVF